MDVKFPTATGNFRQNPVDRLVETGYYSRRGLKNLVVILMLEIKHMGVWRQLAEYFYIKKRDPNAPHTKWMRYMHGINRISLFMFLIALIIIFVRMIFFKR